MNVITKNIKWIMLISGILTCTMFYAVVAPEAAIMFTFGASISDPIAETIVRSWGALVTGVGAMLIFGAFKPIQRSFILVVAGISKIVFIGLVLTFGNQYLGKAGPSLVFDSVLVIIFVLYLANAKTDQPAL